MNSIVKASVGNLDILDNGNVHVSDDHTLRLVIGTNLKMEFRFKTDDSKNEFNTAYRMDGDIWVWDLINYKNPLGSGVLSPLEVGTLNGKKLYVSFFSWKPSEISDKRILNYVIYKEK